MKMFLGSFVQKIMAVLAAVLMPFASLAPAIPATAPANNAKTTTPAQEIIVRAEAEAEEDAIVLAEDEIPATVIAAEEAEDDAVAPAAEAAEETYEVERAHAEARAEYQANYVPVETWDVSATDEDDVTMAYYREADEDFFDAITASVRALFVPMTAYAADYYEIPNNGVATLDADYEEVPDDNGGTIVLSGEGATGTALFENWLNDDFIDFYEAWCDEQDYEMDKIYILNEDISIVGEYNGPMVSAEEAKAEAARRNEPLLHIYHPVYMCEIVYAVPNFWQRYARFDPEYVIVTGKVEVINFAAFSFCTNLKGIYFETDTVKKIAPLAFFETGLTELKLPQGIEKIGEYAFQSCLDLADVYLPATLYYIGVGAFADLGDHTNFYCQTDAVSDLLDEGDKNETFYNADYSRKVTRPDLFTY